MLVKHLKTEQGDIIIFDDSKIKKNSCDHNQVLTAVYDLLRILTTIVNRGLDLELQNILFSTILTKI